MLANLGVEPTPDADGVLYGVAWIVIIESKDQEVCLSCLDE